MSGTGGPRVVSLVPSVTETLRAWGVTPLACTRFCEQPDLPHVGGTKDPDVAAIVDLGPDLVVMCVEENRREDADALAAAGVVTASLSIDSVADVAPALRMLGGLVGVAAEVPDLDLDLGPRPVVQAFVPIWKRPWMTLSGGTYGSSLLAAVGVGNVFAGDAERYPVVTLEEARSRRPDVVLAPSEPYPFAERHVPALSAVAPVVLVDGQDLFWWGARTRAAIDRLGGRLRDAGVLP
ncbi:MAG TPA: helical backbone metal receptor [Acidimicrobiales bacterium]|nr:helical backbone metal receptor [Acidimicrobiales bacterium]